MKRRCGQSLLVGVRRGTFRVDAVELEVDGDRFYISVNGIGKAAFKVDGKGIRIIPNTPLP